MQNDLFVIRWLNVKPSDVIADMLEKELLCATKSIQARQ